MKTSLKLIAFGAALLAAAAPSLLSAKVVVGEAAPDFSLTDLSGRTYQLQDLRGKTVVLEWVNPDCPFVQKHYESGNMPNLQKRATEDGAVWLTINSGKKGAQGDYSPDEIRRWMEKVDAAPTAYFRDQDGKVGRLYEAKTTPHMFVINPEGKLVYDGAIDSIRSANKKDLAKAENYVAAALAAVKEGRMPERTTSEPYGCSVKY